MPADQVRIEVPVTMELFAALEEYAEFESTGRVEATRPILVVELERLNGT